MGCGASSGLTKVNIDHAVTWKEAEALANVQAGGLPTSTELRNAGVSAGNGVDLWMPVRRDDGREGDFCQIGNHPINPQRYISHIDAFGMPGWYQNNDAASWRPTTFFYAKAGRAKVSPGAEVKEVNKSNESNVECKGSWEVYHNIDMCNQGDAEIIHDWRSKFSIEQLKKMVEHKNYSAVCVGSFGHAAFKKFDFQLTKDHCQPSRGYTNELHIWFPKGLEASSATVAKENNGLTRVKIDHAVTWKEAEMLANERAGGLPTSTELRIAGVTAGDGVDLWMPVRRDDGREGDFCQIGNHPINPQRYISHVDAFGMPGWYQNNDAAAWRPTTFFYAKETTRQPSDGQHTAKVARQEEEEDEVEEEDNGPSFPVTIKMITGKEITVDVGATNTVLKLKQKIRSKENISVAKQRLVANGVTLANKQRISEYELTRGSVIFLVLQCADEDEEDGVAQIQKNQNEMVKESKGSWEVYHNIDMCGQGDCEIIHDWRSKFSIEQLKKMVEDKNYSAISVGSFGHAGLKKFDFQLTKDHCQPSRGYTNELHIWFPKGLQASSAPVAKESNGLTRVRIDHAVTWKEAQMLANEQAGGLPTCTELRTAGVTAGDGVDLWMPVRREDGREGDFCQIGNHPANPQRYISHVDAFGMPGWYQNNDAASWRPTTFFYAKAGRAKDSPGAEVKEVNKSNESNVECKGSWEVYHNIDMCNQGDAEIIHDWRSKFSIEQLKKMVQDRNYSAVCVGSFGHGALKKFDFQLTKDHCQPSRGYTNELHIWFPKGLAASGAPDPSRASFKLHGWSGYNSRFNGDYTPTLETVNSKPVFRHMPTEGVGAHIDWCRMYHAHGAWRIGHMAWVHGDNARCCAFVESDASHPSGISSGAKWKEHKGSGANQDHGTDKRDFKDVHGHISVSSGSDAPQPAKAHASPELNSSLNSTARNTNNVQEIRDLVSRGADLASTNGHPWNHTALHQACFHNRPQIVRVLLELGAYEKCAHLASNPCGRGGSGLPIDLARGGGHSEVVKMLEQYEQQKEGNACMQDNNAAPVSLEAVAANPSAYNLVMSGHERPDCNGVYVYDGQENGKPKFSKTPGGAPKVSWTNWGRGAAWDIYWGGFSPEAPIDTPVPPLSGYTRDQGGSNIQVKYVQKSAADGEWVVV